MIFRAPEVLCATSGCATGIMGDVTGGLALRGMGSVETGHTSEPLISASRLCVFATQFLGDARS